MKNGATTLDDLHKLITGIADGQRGLEKRFDDQDAYLEHSFMTIQQQFMSFEEKLDVILAEIEQMKTWFDRQEKVNDIEETERLAMGQKIERTIRWCKELAKEIGYDLKV